MQWGFSKLLYSPACFTPDSRMTVDEEWLALQPAGAPEATEQAAADGCLDGPCQPLQLGQGHQGGWGDRLISEIEPASPREGAAAAAADIFPGAAGSRASAGGGPGGGGSGPSGAGQEGAGGEGEPEEEQLVMQKHLAFSSPQARQGDRG